MPNVAVLIAIGGSAGFLAGMLGAGGGFATVVMLLAAGVDIHAAVGTSLAFAMVVAAWGAAVHVRKGHARGRLGIAIGLAAAMTAPFGARLAHALSDRVLTASFGLMLGVVGVAFFLRSDFRRSSGRDHMVDVPSLAGAQMAAAPAFDARLIASAAAGGAFIGVLQGLFGVGGGFLLVPFMVLILHVEERRAIGNSLVAILIGGISGSIGHASLGSVDAEILWFLIPAGVMGALGGVLALRKVSMRLVRIAFVALIAISSVYLMVHAFA